ncbi:adenylyl-sulfate kinase [Psychrobium sp. 1_MG-2023]|uniref:adenylyl-sulfate kinase n=1 Tax=Psychrobium sp. 1_MG-2023 TaxID=3062624 RepID=UPI000C34A664|nr:adenylyl-sulfate kinase [Psychrobium sp. 1_MG-2023]MDP2560090.1 adenylyl-sulfate kinase [Psychrobium sp. 1_MG-2023]PKF56251.1 adenylyl-sulfate kinase [Alteromonadales bacterium alter-6D02]
MSDENIVWHQHAVDKALRGEQKRQKPCVLWFTGLSGSGKSTVAGALERVLYEAGQHTYLLDGDNVRHGLCGDLGFDDAARQENIRRVGEVAKLMADAGLIVLSAFISPFTQEREQVRAMLNEGEFIEVHIATSLAACEERDPKGLYKKARAGEIKHFTGIDSEYQAPKNPEIVIQTEEQTLEQSVEQLVNYLREQGYIS